MNILKLAMISIRRYFSVVMDSFLLWFFSHMYRYVDIFFVFHGSVLVCVLKLGGSTLMEKALSKPCYENISVLVFDYIMVCVLPV